MQDKGYRKLFHCVYQLQYHLVIVTKYRNRCLTKQMLAQLRTICEEQLARKEGALLEFNGEADHLHLLIELPPKASVSSVVNSLKTVTARLLRRDFGAHLRRYYWKPILWSRSYFVASCGGAPLSVIRQYIQQQEAPH